MSGHQAVAVAAGKYRTAVATITGNVYAWDGEGSKADVRPAPVRVHGAKHVTRLSVGETHSLAVSSLYAPTYFTKPVSEQLVISTTREEEESADDDNLLDEECGTIGTAAPTRVDEGVPSLKDLCQKVVTESIVEPKNALQLLEFADSMGADHLKRYCEVNSSLIENLLSSMPLVLIIQYVYYMFTSHFKSDSADNSKFSPVILLNLSKDLAQGVCGSQEYVAL